MDISFLVFLHLRKTGIRKGSDRRCHNGASPCRRQSIQPGAVDLDLVFQCPAACHDTDIQHQIYEKK